ncbi:MAG: tetratricopeptide repeat protein [Thermoleophilia bacterium]
MKTGSISRSIVRTGMIVLAMGAIILAVIPWYADHLRNTSLKQAEMGYRVDSLQTAEAAVFYNPLSVQSLFVLAGAQQRIGRLLEAETTLTRATQIQPQNYATWEQLALYERDRLNEPDKAAEYFRKAVDLNPVDQHLKAEAGMAAD